MSSCSAVAFIFARGGSKGLPGKNIRPFAGKPLIAHAVETALASRSVGRVMVSTDDPEIAEAARAAGAEIPFMRPAELASDTSPEWLSWRHAVEHLASQGALPEVFITVPATAPLRLPQDIDACVERFAKGDVDVVFTVTASAANPYFNLVSLNPQGHAERMPLEGGISRRQDVPSFYEIIPACYVSTPKFIRQASGLFDGTVGVVEIPRHRAADIDDLTDFVIAQALWPYRHDGTPT
jgi:N-acylneuraminate cytidylyltransferase